MQSHEDLIYTSNFLCLQVSFLVIMMCAAEESLGGDRRWEMFISYVKERCARGQLERKSEESEPPARGRCIWKDQGGGGRKREGVTRGGSLWKETQWVPFFIEVEGKEDGGEKESKENDFADR